MKIKKLFRLQTSSFESQKGFTLIELLIVIGIIAVLMAIAIVTINPGKQFAKAHNAKRWGDVSAIADAISLRIIENKGGWPTDATCPALPTVTGALIKNPCGAGETCYNLCDCIVDEYLGSVPFDPTATNAGWTDCSNYNSGYTFTRTATGRITISAPAAQPEDGSAPIISVTR